MLARTDGPSVPATTISIACSRRPVSLPGQPASSMKPTQKSGPGSSARSSESETCTPRMRARWSARSRWRPSRASDVAARLSIGTLELVVRHDPSVPAAAALRAVDDERTGPQRDARQAARGDVNVGPCEHERSQVLVAWSERSAVEHRLDRQCDHRLRDERTRGGNDPAAELLTFFDGRGGADEHPVTTGRVHRFDDHAVEVL